MLKQLFKSKTIWGAITMLVAFVTSNSSEIFTPEFMAQYGVHIKAIAALLAASGFSGTVYGRAKAKGPLTKMGDQNTDKDIGR